MIRRQLKTFFLERKENREILKLLHANELTLIERFLSTNDEKIREQLATDLMEITLDRIDPEFRLFLRLFEVESDKLATMEKGIVYMKEDYRSHYIHSVYTYLLGFFLLKKTLLGPEFLHCVNLDYFDVHYKEHPNYDDYVVPKENEGQEFQRRWALTVFFHDIAYLSQVNLKLMQTEGQRLTALESPYSIEITNLKSFLTNPVMSEIKKKLKMSFAPEYLFKEDMLAILSCRLVNRLGCFSEELIYRSLKEWISIGLKEGKFDHGAMGATFLLQRFYALLYKFFIDIEKEKKRDVPPLMKYSINRNIIRFTDAMAASALHNIKYFNTGIFKENLNVKISNHRLPLAFLLILCDELQAWNRELSPPPEYTQRRILRAISARRLDKNIFLEHFRYFYQVYASPQITKHELKITLPFWNDKKDKEEKPKKYQIITRDMEILAIEFTWKSSSTLNRIAPLNTGDYLSLKIQKKTFKEMEKESWEKFSKDNQTLACFIDLALKFEEYLSLCTSEGEAPETKKTKALEHLNTKLLPALVLLKKGQDVLLAGLKPHHFHEFAKPKDPGSEKSEPIRCKLLLHFPGKEVQDIEKVIKNKLEKKLYIKKAKELTMEYADAPAAQVNRTINEYIEKIEECIYFLQLDVYTIKKDL